MSEGQLKEKETWSDIRTILGKFKRTTKIRASNQKSSPNILLKVHIPVIVCGDFNETPQSFAYRNISEQLKRYLQRKRTWD